jgi:hypothetical protein
LRPEESGRILRGEKLFLARFILKRTILIILLTAGFTAMVSAQGWGRGWNFPNTPTPPPRPVVETVTISGSLIVANSMPALKSGDDTYILTGVNRLIGFIDGFKEGAQISVEGSAVTDPRNSKLKFLRPIKMTLGGKSYDLSPLVSPDLNRPQAPMFQAPQVPPGNQRRQFDTPNPRTPAPPRVPAPRTPPRNFRRGRTL